MNLSSFILNLIQNLDCNMVCTRYITKCFPQPYNYSATKTKQNAFHNRGTIQQQKQKTRLNYSVFFCCLRFVNYLEQLFVDSNRVTVGKNDRQLYKCMFLYTQLLFLFHFILNHFSVTQTGKLLIIIN